MKRFILLFCMVVALVSCSNDIDFTQSYTATKIETEGIKLYTRNGELKNTEQINSFIKRHQSYFNIPSSQMLARLIEIPSKVSFISSQEAQFSFYESDAINVNVVRINDVIYIESKDTTDSGMRYYKYPMLQPTIYDAMLKYSELYRDTVNIHGANDVYEILEKRCNYFTQSGNMLKMPFLNYWYFQPYSTQTASIINNAFNISCIGMLEENDTLAIEQQQVVFN